MLDDGRTSGAKTVDGSGAIEQTEPGIDSWTSDRQPVSDDARKTDNERFSKAKQVIHRVYSLIKSDLGLMLLLTVYSFLGAAILHATESVREKELHTELSTIKRSVVHRIISNVTAWSCDSASSNVTDELVTAVDALLSEYGDARESLRPSSKSPGWSFFGALYFCGTVYTTIGYGNVSPVTTAGQAITIVYAALGIPLCLVVLANLGKTLTRISKFIWLYIRRLYYTGSLYHVQRMIPLSHVRMSFFQRLRYRLGRTWRFRARRNRDSEAQLERVRQMNETRILFEVDDKFDLPVAVALIVAIGYMLIGALLYTRWEEWTYMEAFYFLFISLCTIGFGDVVPHHPKFFMATALYLFVGLALFAMVINVIMVSLHVTIEKATDQMKLVTRRLTEPPQMDAIARQMEEAQTALPGFNLQKQLARRETEEQSRPQRSPQRRPAPERRQSV